MNETIVSSDGMEPCASCYKQVPVSQAILVRSLGKHETLRLKSRINPYEPGVAICCSQACVDRISESRMIAYEIARHHTPCPHCGHFLSEDGDFILYCETCGYIEEGEES